MIMRGKLTMALIVLSAATAAAAPPLQLNQPVTVPLRYTGSTDGRRTLLVAPDGKYVAGGKPDGTLLYFYHPGGCPSGQKMSWALYPAPVNLAQPMGIRGGLLYWWEASSSAVTATPNCIRAAGADTPEGLWDAQGREPMLLRATNGSEWPVTPKLIGQPNSRCPLCQRNLNPGTRAWYAHRHTFCVYCVARRGQEVADRVKWARENAGGR